jgi:ADP-ribose pyrophosphatase YjhB (NUDIX family)
MSNTLTNDSNTYQPRTLSVLGGSNNLEEYEIDLNQLDITECEINTNTDVLSKTDAIDLGTDYLGTDGLIIDQINNELSEGEEYVFDENNKSFNYRRIDYKKSGWKKRDNIYCNNCGKYGHTFRKCYDPITSYGIICFKVSNKKIYEFFQNKYKFPDNSQILKNICVNKYIQKNISCNNRKDLDLFESKVLKGTEYLMVRRKHTYNYIHLIRGMYEIELEQIIKSINLLTYTEYINLQTKDFDEQWKMIWSNNEIPETVDHNSDYYRAKEQFGILKELILPQISHRINITYPVAEWGFPKGKRNGNESNIDCAKREFEEETGLNDSDYVVLDRLYPLIENVVGSNGVNYKHVYYIGLLDPDINKTEIKINQDNIQAYEIGDIGLFSTDESYKMIRDYNNERKQIINSIKLFLTYNTRYFEKFYHEK